MVSLFYLVSLVSLFYLVSLVSFPKLTLRLLLADGAPLLGWGETFGDGYKQAIDKIWGPVAKNGFSGENPTTTGQSCAKKKVAFSQLNISLLVDFGCFLKKKKRIFGMFPAIWQNVKTRPFLRNSCRGQVFCQCGSKKHPIKRPNDH